MDWLSNEKDLGDEIKTQKGLSFIAFGPERKKMIVIFWATKHLWEGL